MFIHSLNPNQHYKTEAPWKPCWWSLLQGPWTSSQPTFWWFSAVKRWCRARDSGLKFELGAGAKSTVSWAPLAMTERPSDATRLVTGQNSEFFFMLSKSTLDISQCALSYPLWGNGTHSIQLWILGGNRPIFLACHDAEGTRSSATAHHEIAADALRLWSFYSGCKRFPSRDWGILAGPLKLLGPQTPGLYITNRKRWPRNAAAAWLGLANGTLMACDSCAGNPKSPRIIFTTVGYSVKWWTQRNRSLS